MERVKVYYPSDHDLLDFAARDSKIAELTAENEDLKAELEKYKPKRESKAIDLYLYKDGHGNIGISWGGESEIKMMGITKVIARKTVTITEGEGM